MFFKKNIFLLTTTSFIIFTFLRKKIFFLEINPIRKHKSGRPGDFVCAHLLSLGYEIEKEEIEREEERKEKSLILC